MRNLKNLFELESFVLMFFISLGAGLALGCAKPRSSSTTESSTTPAAGRYLYVSTGVCHSGGSLAVYTAATASNQVFRINTSTGVKDITLADYTSAPSQAADSPVAIVNSSSNDVFVLVENATANLRRIEKVSKSLNGSRAIVLFGNGTTAANQLRDISLTPQNDFLMTRNSGIEKITSNGTRVTNGTLAFVVPPTTGGCAMPTGGTMSRGLALPNGMIAMANVTLGTLSKVGIVSASGYGSAANCLSSAQSPLNSSSLPTSLAFDSTNSLLLVAYAGYNATAATKVNTIYAYTVNTTTGVLGATPTRIYDQTDSSFPTFLYGISAMALDSDEGYLYVASSRGNSATSSGHFIEKFQYNPSNISGTLSTSALTRVGNTPFFNYTIDTKCISGLFVAD